MQRTRKKSNAFVRVKMERRKKNGMACGTNSKWQPTDKCYSCTHWFLWHKTKTFGHGTVIYCPLKLEFERKFLLEPHNTKAKKSTSTHRTNFFVVVVVASVIYSVINYNFCFIVAQCYGLIRFQALIQWHGKSMCTMNSEPKHTIEM